MKFDEKLLESHPSWFLVKKIAERLKEWEPCLVGGSVRDLLLGRTPHDLDLASRAHPEKVLELFPNAKPLGVEFGVVLIHENGQSVEVTSFRKDGLYINGRRPQNVEWASLEEDSARRDFTVNAIYYKILTNEILDPTGGLQDLQVQQLRAIGQPEQRFKEDHLRILRGIRFASQLGFQLEQKTWDAICEGSELLRTVSPERILAELKKMAQSGQCYLGLMLLIDSGGFAVLFPELNIANHEKELKQSFKFTFQDINNEEFFWLSLLLPWIATLSEKQCVEFVERRKLSKQIGKNILRVAKIVRGEWCRLSFGAQVAEALSGLSLEQIRWFQSWIRNKKKLFWFQNLSSESEVVLNIFTNILNEFPQGLPPKLVEAKDLLSHFSKQQLGDKLKKCYELQLENLEMSREELIQKVLN